MAVILDAGGLIAIDRGDRSTTALLRVAQAESIPVRTSAGAVAQVWRGSRQANLARILTGTETAPLDRQAAKWVGELLARAGTSDVVDGHVSILVNPNDTIVTSDADDMRGLLQSRGVKARIHQV
ncbi:MAG TPA: hypothetical protein VG298_17995 [Acidimicrobiales bacterium]|jgi:hypothetical protein|nr:hypothetical protein [Acidimicrobiales bacterium]